MFLKWLNNNLPINKVLYYLNLPDYYMNSEGCRIDEAVPIAISSAYPREAANKRSFLVARPLGGGGGGKGLVIKKKDRFLKLCDFFCGF